MTNNFWTLCYISIIIAVVISRIILTHFPKTNQPQIRFLFCLILLAMYTIILLAAFHIIYISPNVHQGDIHQFYLAIILITVGINFALAIVALVYYLLRPKRPISDIDRMKLKDL